MNAAELCERKRKERQNATVSARFYESTPSLIWGVGCVALRSGERPTPKHKHTQTSAILHANNLDNLRQHCIYSCILFLVRSFRCSHIIPAAQVELYDFFSFSQIVFFRVCVWMRHQFIEPD